MTFELDARIRALIDAGAGPTGTPSFAAYRPGDGASLRAVLNEGLSQLSLLPAVTDVRAVDDAVQAPDGEMIRVRWTAPIGALPGSAVLFLHGGAMIAGSVDLYDPLVRTYVAATGVPFLAVDYRLSPESPAGTAALDALAALHWLVAHSEGLEIDPGRIAVMGDSAGGGPAAALAVLARDAGIALAAQILIYPMLDDRTEPDPRLEGVSSMFRHDFARTAWSAVLGDLLGEPEAPPTAVPARAENLEGVAPAFIEVGELDVFRDEDIAYATRLWRSGVSTELHVRAGYPHAFDVLLLGDEGGRRSLDDKTRIIGRI